MSGIFGSRSGWTWPAAMGLLYSSRVRHRHAARVLALLVLLTASASAACNAITSVIVTGADYGGASADAHCDRRDVADGGQASAFCQEVVATIAASQFSDDCRHKFQATTGAGLCPRARIIAGCKLDKKSDDGSEVWDWYYDVSDLLAEAGTDAGPDGGPTFAAPVPRDVTAVAALCADRTRYEEGAELAFP